MAQLRILSLDPRVGIATAITTRIVIGTIRAGGPTRTTTEASRVIRTGWQAGIMIMTAAETTIAAMRPLAAMIMIAGAILVGIAIMIAAKIVIVGTITTAAMVRKTITTTINSS
jgi:hypothetical protein